MPSTLSQWPGITVEATYGDPALDIVIQSVRGFGKVTARLDYEGFLRDVKIEGAFTELHPKVVYTDALDPRLRTVEF